MFKILSILFELFAGLRATLGVNKVVTIFGSARLRLGHEHYDAAVSVAERLAKEGYAVLTGGGPGIMEAANKGAILGGAQSIGCTIKLPFEQQDNGFLNRKAAFKRFFLRKFVMTRSADAFVVFAGGYGTLDELFEVLTLIQCRKQERPVKVVLYGSDFWGGLISWLRQVVCGRYKTISGEDIFLFSVVDTVDEAVAAVCAHSADAVISPAAI